VNIAPSFSTYLDLVRAACAIAVVFHHYSKHIVRAFPRVFPDVGQEAVMVFFVLSGFVIAHVARRSENDPVVFATKRLARVYPVAIAGVVLSYALYALCAPLDPGLYADRVSPHPWWHEVGLTLTFLNQSLWFPHVMPPTNGPYWSLTCEIWFYVLAAVMFFAPLRWTLFAIVFAVPVLGPKIMLLFPVWLVGLCAERLCDRPRIPRPAAGALAFVSLAAAVGLWWSGARADWRVPAEIAGAWRLGRTSDFVYYNVFALLIGVHLFAAYNLFTGRFTWPVRARRWIGHAAATSFSLYAMHFPILYAFRSAVPHEPFHYFYPVATVGLVLLLGRPIENLRGPAYRGLRRLETRVRSVGREPVLDPVDHFP
jgi:peptidoglycan/LPS O-acetylase OafA/YrhL